MSSSSFFFFTATATTEIYTLSLHDALPILKSRHAPEFSHPNHERLVQQPAHLQVGEQGGAGLIEDGCVDAVLVFQHLRSEEHTSELQSHSDLVCRLLLEKKKQRTITHLL